LRAQGGFVTALVIAVLGIVLVGSGTVRAAWLELAELLSIIGDPEPASANVLSEHEIERLDEMEPQHQAELLLERSLNHYRGANEQIAARVERWRGRLEMDGRLDALFRLALYSNDLRVRAAALEVNIVGRKLEKTIATVDRLEPLARNAEQGPRANALWDIGLLGNRGVEPERAAEILLASIHDENINVRYWAVEALAHLGTNAAIEPLLGVLHDDPSPMIRERAACALAQSGMLTERQRRMAVPRLLQYADDGALDDETRKWVFQALRDITGESLPHSADDWRDWYRSSARDRWHPVTRDRG
jgi:HEAT repeat protein